MCGITAVSRAAISSIPDIRPFARLAALAIEPRGRDATGFAWNDDDGQWYWKTPRSARDAVRDSPVAFSTHTLIGHTRMGTKGPKTNNENNHPVVDDGIRLVHNGIINNDWEIYKALGSDFVKKAEVDTAAAAALLANLEMLGAEHPVEVLDRIKGSAALAWLDYAEPTVLHLARCQERPLTLGWTRRGDLVMSSTPETLTDLSTWANVRIRDFYEVPEGTYLRVEGGVITERRTFTPPTYSYQSSTYSYQGGQRGTYSSSDHKADIDKSEGRKSGKKGQKPEFVFPDEVEGWENWTAAEWQAWSDSVELDDLTDPRFVFEDETSDEQRDRDLSDVFNLTIEEYQRRKVRLGTCYDYLERNDIAPEDVVNHVDQVEMLEEAARTCDDSIWEEQHHAYKQWIGKHAVIDATFSENESYDLNPQGVWERI